MSIRQPGITTGYVPPDVIKHDIQRAPSLNASAVGWTYDVAHDHLRWATSPRAILGARWPADWASLDDEQLGRKLLEPTLTATSTITDSPIDATVRIPCADGERTVLVVAQPDMDRVSGWTGFVQDITEAEASESAMQELLVRYQMLTDLSPDCIAVHQNGKVVYANQATLRFVGLPDRESVIGRSIFDFIPAPVDVTKTIANITSMTKVGEFRHHGEMIIRSATGDEFIMDSISMFTVWDGHPAHQVILRDITDIKEVQKKLEWQASHDQLTGLGNREALVEAIRAALDRSGRGHVGVLHLTLDRFGLINDNFGYAGGDLALQQIAQRLHAMARRGDVVARLGSDSFGVLCPNVSTNDLHKIASRLAQAVQEPVYPVDERGVALACSIGVACCQRGEQDPDWLLRGADMAVRTAQRRGGGTVCLYDDRMRSRSLAQLEIASDLREAIEQQQLQAYFQPITDCVTGEVVGMEALARWDHHRHGMIPPPEFISVAEETGLIIQLGRFMIDQACAQIAHWCSLPGRHANTYVSVNLSVKQLEDRELANWIRECLERHGVQAADLVLEVTESMLMQDLVNSVQRLRDIRSLGVRLAMDDFGTGYSSLAHLQRLPFDILKVDKTFVDEVCSVGGGGSSIVAGILMIARSLRLAVCAEGVETAEQAGMLGTLGCDTYQGYLATPPLPSQRLDEWFAKRYLEQS